MYRHGPGWGGGSTHLNYGGYAPLKNWTRAERGKCEKLGVFTPEKRKIKQINKDCTVYTTFPPIPILKH